LRRAKILFDAGDIEGVRALASERAGFISQLGGDPSDTNRIQELAISTLQGSQDAFQALGAELNAGVQAAIAGGFIPEGQEGRTFAPIDIVSEEGDVVSVIPTVVDGKVVNLPVGARPKATPEQAADIAVGKTEKVEGIKTGEQRKRTRQEQQDVRENEFITSSFTAAQELPDLRRSIELLNTVETGGFEQAKLAAQDFFGVTPADIGELRGLLGQNILAGLSAFTGAISEGERQFLQEISANIGQGKEVNRRQLMRLKRIQENALRRGAEILQRRADEGDETARQTLELFNEERRISEDLAKLPPGTSPIGNGRYQLPDGTIVERE
jgi:hypothetical protein